MPFLASPPPSPIAPKVQLKSAQPSQPKHVKKHPSNTYKQKSSASLSVKSFAKPHAPAQPTLTPLQLHYHTVNQRTLERQNEERARTLALDAISMKEYYASVRRHTDMMYWALEQSINGTYE